MKLQEKSTTTRTESPSSSLEPEIVFIETLYGLNEYYSEIISSLDPYSLQHTDTTPAEVLTEIIYAVQAPNEVFAVVTLGGRFLGFLVCRTYLVTKGRTRFEVAHTYLEPCAPRNLLPKIAQVLWDFAKELGCHVFGFTVSATGKRALAMFRRVGLPVRPYLVRFEGDLTHG
jgi:hypothetical protein